MADTIQTQIERDILPWILSVKKVAAWTVQPGLKIYRVLEYVAQVALVLGGIGVSYPALSFIASTTEKGSHTGATSNAESAHAASTNPPPKSSAPATSNADPKQNAVESARVQGEESSSKDKTGNKDAEPNWLVWLIDFTRGEHAGVAVVLLLGWGTTRVYFQKEKMAERSVLVDSMQTEGRKLEKALRDSLRDPTRTSAELVDLQNSVNNLINTHVSAKSYPGTAPLDGTDETAKAAVAKLKTTFPNAPWAQALDYSRH